MSLQELVIQSQLHPPRPGRNVLRRPRLEARMAAILDHPLTILQAGTGYGKSTALAALNKPERSLFWYTITAPERDPLLFLVHLISAFGVFGREALQSLETNGIMVTPAALNPMLNALTKHLSNETILVLDDYHLVAGNAEISSLIQKLVDYCPPRLHIVLSTRQMPELPDFNRWRVKGLLLLLNDSDLAFTAEEIETLFRDHYRHPITQGEAKALADETEGWAIAVQMVWQSIQAGTIPDIATALQRMPETFDRLFDYLAPEVLARQPQEWQQFLLTTAVLRQLDGQACDALLGGETGSDMLRQLHEAGLFIDRVGEEAYRYQHLFRDFLLNEIGRHPEEKISLHRRAARYFGRAGHAEERLHHLLEAGDFQQAGDLIGRIGADALASGRLDSLSDWLARLPDKVLQAHPALELLYGDVCRQRAEFDQALDHYHAAVALYQKAGDHLGQSRALRGQAQLYLDTVRPLQAAALLTEALELLDPQEHIQETADLLDQLAENKLNFGFPDQARALHEESLRTRKEADPTDIYLSARILLRTGKLNEGQRQLESYNLDEPPPGLVRPQHFHREKQLLLSLLCSLQGDQAGAETYARQAIAIGQKIASEYVQAVAYMRLGHALQLDGFTPWGGKRRGAAIRCYHESIEKARPFKVARVNLEPLWGLTRAYGYDGDVETAEKYAIQALEIARTAGDEWVGHMVRVTMGASLAMDGRSSAAARWLKEAAEGLNRVQDTFGWSAAQLWLALSAWFKGDEESALRHLSALLSVVSEYGYETLLIKCTHIGLRDDQMAIPLLLEGYRQNIEREYILKLLSQARKRGLVEHPGYTLWVRTLGPFAAWRGSEMVAAGEWQREKARLLFQLFIATRGQWLGREQITDMLWPDLPEENARRDFKVALNALQRALEPGRERNTASHFIIRQGNAYGINPQAQLVTDADVFAALVASNDTGRLEEALELYQDDLLPECRYFDWSTLGRENTRQKFLAASERLGDLYLQEQRWEDALELGMRALKHEKCWEPAYKMMIKAHLAQGNIAQARAVYQRCLNEMRQELGLEPSDELQRLWQQMSRG